MSRMQQPEMENRVLLLLPSRKDTAMARSVLAQAGITCVPCSDLSELCRELAAGAAAVVSAEETLRSGQFEVFLGLLRDQPVWSDVPVLVLGSGGGQSPQSGAVLQQIDNLILLAAPVQIDALLSAVRTALRARRRQYQLRQYLAERAEVEKALRESEDRFRLAVAATRALVYDIDLTTGRVAGFDGLYELLGYRSDEVPISRQWWFEQVHPDDPTIEQANEAFRIQDTYSAEYRVRHKDGHYVYVVDTGQVIRNGSAAPVRIVGSATDITERKQAEQELKAAKDSAERAKAVAEQANHAKDHFLAVLSHELRTPLTPVVMGVSMLQDRPNLDAGMREMLDSVRRNIEMEVHLIDDLLDVTRIARGKIELKRSPVELCTVIYRAVEVCKADIEARRLHFGVDLGHRAPYWVDADVPRLQQVFWNLLRNAIKFTPHGGCVGVRCRPNEEHVIVEVNDSGIGIEPESLSRVFNAFDQVERSITQQFGGLGLGLTISKALVEMHGGEIHAHSEGRGKGATFRIRLPLTAPAGHPEMPARAAPPTPAVRPLHILLVEDHGVTAKMMRMVLTAEGHTVETAGDIATGLELAGQQPFDLLLSDLGLPDGSGHDLIRGLRSRGHNLPGIALSGYGQEEDIRRSREVGFAAHLTKPASRDSLLEAIASVTAREMASSMTEPTAALESSSPSEPTVFDADAALKRCFGKPDFLRGMMDSFLSDSPAMLNRLRAAADKGDAAEVAATAHQLAGTLTFLNATEAIVLAQQVVQNGRSGDLAAAAEAIGRLQPQVTTLRDAVSQHLRGGQFDSHREGQEYGQE